MPHPKLHTLRHRRHVQSLTLVFKSYKTGGAKYIAEMFDVKETKYNGFEEVAVNLVSLDLILNSPTDISHTSLATCGNTLPDDIRNSSNVNAFIN